jgi:oligopeptide transport system substrate-binding protein
MKRHMTTNKKPRHVMLSRVFSFVIIAALLCVGLIGCAPQERGVLRIGNGSEPQGLDPHLIQGVPEHRLTSTLFEGLVDAAPETLTPIPGVAESWTVSDDGIVYTFHLRENALWSDGDPVTAEDFVYSWKRILTPSLAAPYAYMLHCIKNAKAYNEGALTDFVEVGVKALGDRDLEVRLENPTPYFLSMQIHFTWYPVHRENVERFGRMDERNTKWTRPGNLVGNGAFKLNRWVPNNVIEVVKNERYWNAANVRLEKIRFYPIDNAMTEERGFRTGLLDVTENLPITKAPKYRLENPEALRTDPYFGTYFYRVNTTRSPFTDVRVRRAFAMALDRDSVAKKVMTGGQQPAGTLTPPKTAGYVNPPGIPFDPKRARELLAEAGYPDGKGLPPVELLFNTSENHKMIAEAIQQMWKKELNAEVTLANQDWKVYLASQKNLDYGLARGSWIGDYLDPNSFLECFLTGGGNNNTGWSNEEFDSLLAEASRTADVNNRYEILKRAETILLDDAPVIPIYFYTRVYLHSPKVGNWQMNPLGYISFKDLYIEEPSS